MQMSSITCPWLAWVTPLVVNEVGHWNESSWASWNTNCKFHPMIQASIICAKWTTWVLKCRILSRTGQVGVGPETPETWMDPTNTWVTPGDHALVNLSPLMIDSTEIPRPSKLEGSAPSIDRDSTLPSFTITRSRLISSTRPNLNPAW